MLYLDSNKKRTEKWMQSVGLQLPSDATAFGSVGSITYPDGIVKIEGIPYKKYLEKNIKRDVKALDAEYLAAVERGDMETAQQMVDEAAKRAGYTDSEEWRMDHILTKNESSLLATRALVNLKNEATYATALKLTIADFLDIVNITYQSILSDDV